MGDGGIEIYKNVAPTNRKICLAGFPVYIITKQFLDVDFMLWEHLLKGFPVSQIQLAYGSRASLNLWNHHIIRDPVFLHEIFLGLLPYLRKQSYIRNAIPLHGGGHNPPLHIIVLEDVVYPITIHHGIMHFGFDLRILTGILIPGFLLVRLRASTIQLLVGLVEIAITIILGSSLPDFPQDLGILAGVDVTRLSLIVLHDLLHSLRTSRPRGPITVSSIERLANLCFDLRILTGVVVARLSLVRSSLLFVLPFQCDVIIVIGTTMLITKSATTTASLLIRAILPH